ALGRLAMRDEITAEQYTAGETYRAARVAERHSYGLPDLRGPGGPGADLTDDDRARIRGEWLAVRQALVDSGCVGDVDAVVFAERPEIAPRCVGARYGEGGVRFGLRALVRHYGL
ncbi:MAG: hypothetical protein AAFR28_03540, partial [Pseudomonadota bacterium]